MTEIITGIVLRTFHHGRICVFTQQLGKIFCTNKTKKHSFVPGSLLVANLAHPQTPAIRIEHIHDITYPAIETIHDLTWLHHIVELYYFFMPEHQASQVDYDFFSHYIAAPKKISTSAQEEIHLQYLAVSHFLSQAGFYEHPALRNYAKNFEEVIDRSSVSAVPFSVTSSEERFIRDLILGCLQEHPQYRNFKTISFLYQVYSL
jgi:hypothetical protein